MRDMEWRMARPEESQLFDLEGFRIQTVTSYI
jgi:hypothetical protein